MSRRTALAVAILGMALGHGVAAPSLGAGIPQLVPISAYDDDPFAADAVIERISRWTFGEEGGDYLLAGPFVHFEDDTVVYREDPATGLFHAFAWNPWSPELRRSNAEGHFAFPDEPRFPLHKVARDESGKIVLVDGLQLWLPQDLRRGLTTTFEAAHAARQAAESWSGRDLAWGQQGRLEINAHAFIDFNAFFSPSARALFFGVVPYRLGGPTQPVYMFETASSWEFAAHEAGHALHMALKPNRNLVHLGSKAWSESLGDQLAMWASLRDPERARAVAAETGGDLAQSSSLTAMGEAFAALVGEGTGIRDAFHDKKVSDTAPQEHDRSEVLTGAAYDVFVAVYGRWRREHAAPEALARAARVLGTFLVRAADYVPENTMSLEDVGKGYLKVDAELYDGRYHALLVEEFTEREIFDAGSLAEWRAHEASLPDVRLPRSLSDAGVGAWLEANLDALGVGPEFGLALQAVTRIDRVRSAVGPEPTLVRVQLTLGRGAGATPLANHGLLVFRANGTLADWHPPLPQGEVAGLQRGLSPQARARAHALAAISQAKGLGLDRRGAPLALVPREDGSLAAEVHVLRGEPIAPYMEVFTPERPEGERREVVVPPVPPDRRVPVPGDLLE